MNSHKLLNHAFEADMSSKNRVCYGNLCIRYKVHTHFRSQKSIMKSNTMNTIYREYITRNAQYVALNMFVECNTGFINAGQFRMPRSDTSL